MWDWSTAASLATALGTLVLALATFVAVRAANRAARVAEYSMQIGIRPLLMPSRLTDTEQKIMWGDEHWARLSGAGAVAEIVQGNVYLAMSVRNAGSGVAVIHGWHLVLQDLHQDHPHAEPGEFRRQLISSEARGYHRYAAGQSALPFSSHVRRRQTVPRNNHHDAGSRVDRGLQSLLPINPRPEILHIQPGGYIAFNQSERQRFREIVILA
jgi:hypothetical protein